VSVLAEGRPSTLVEAIFRREIFSWGLIGMTLGLVEGATAAVLVKQHFGAAASRLVVNLAVAVVSGAPALSNVLSFVWANIAHGRARVRLVVALQAAFALLVGTIAFAPRAAGGLALTVTSIVAARVVWGGILTVRAAVWTANYPRNVLARITGRIVIINSLAVATSAALVGWALEGQFIDARWLYGGGALAGLAGVIAGPVLGTFPGMAQVLGSIVFVVVVIGGLGSLTGAFVASLLIGILQTFAVAMDVSVGGALAAVGVPVASGGALHDLWKVTIAQVAPILPYVLLVLTLIVRPTGLFGTRET